MSKQRHRSYESDLRIANAKGLAIGVGTGIASGLVDVSMGLGLTFFASTLAHALMTKEETLAEHALNRSVTYLGTYMTVLSITLAFNAGATCKNNEVKEQPVIMQDNVKNNIVKQSAVSF